MAIRRRVPHVSYKFIIICAVFIGSVHCDSEDDTGDVTAYDAGTPAADDTAIVDNVGASDVGVVSDNLVIPQADDTANVDNFAVSDADVVSDNTVSETTPNYDDTDFDENQALKILLGDYFVDDDDEDENESEKDDTSKSVSNENKGDTGDDSSSKEKDNSANDNSSEKSGNTNTEDGGNENINDGSEKVITNDDNSKENDDKSSSSEIENANGGDMDENGNENGDDNNSGETTKENIGELDDEGGNGNDFNTNIDNVDEMENTETSYVEESSYSKSSEDNESGVVPQDEGNDEQNSDSGENTQGRKSNEASDENSSDGVVGEQNENDSWENKQDENHQELTGDDSEENTANENNETGEEDESFLTQEDSASSEETDNLQTEEEVLDTETGLDRQSSSFDLTLNSFESHNSHNRVKIEKTEWIIPSPTTSAPTTTTTPTPTTTTTPAPTTPPPPPPPRVTQRQKSFKIISFRPKPSIDSIIPPSPGNPHSKLVPRWFLNFMLKKREIAHGGGNHKVLPPNDLHLQRMQTSFWRPPDVAKPPEWQDQRDWITIDLNLQKPDNWENDPSGNGSIPRWNIPFIPPDWFKKRNDKAELHFEFSTPTPFGQSHSSKPKGGDNTMKDPEYMKKKKICDRRFDIVITVDGTKNSRDFGYLKGALVQLLDRLMIHRNKIHVSVVLLQKNRAARIPLSGDKQKLEDAIAKLRLSEDNNRYDIGLRAARETLQFEGRKHVPNVVIMIVNGKSRLPYHTKLEAGRLRRSGASVFVVGVGYKTDSEELDSISSAQNEVIRVKNYVHLVYLMSGYVQLFCNVDDDLPRIPPPMYTRTTPKPRIATRLTTKSAEPSLEKAKVLCEGCKMINGAGYNSHPTECEKFIQCFFGEMDHVRAIIRKCPFGQYWNQTILSCQYAENANCPNDPCNYIRSRAYPKKDNCRAYWYCSGGKSRAKCCAWGYYYQQGKGCVRDIKNTCRMNCPSKSQNSGSNIVRRPPVSACDKMPIPNDKMKYKQRIGYGYVIMPCALGTQFNEKGCTCSVMAPAYVSNTKPYHPETVSGCRPEVVLNFNNGFEDSSGKWTWVNNQRVRIVNGTAYFDGNSRLLIPRFTNANFGKTFIIRLRYMELKPIGYDESQALVNNGDCGDYGSVQIYTKRNSVGFSIKTSKEERHKSLAVPKPRSLWKNVEYILADETFIGAVNGVKSSRMSVGFLEPRQCALQIGFGHGFRNFRGYIDQLEIYMCKPKRPMSYS